MSSPSVPADSASSAAPRPGSTRLGRTFVGPWFDYLLIGGGLSLLVAAIVPFIPLLQVGNMNVAGGSQAALLVFPYVLLMANAAHFAASTVRLYTKPGSYSALPFLTMGFPLVCIAILTACIHWADQLGKPLQALYLTWSPYHYAAQAYGLTVMYCYRSGCKLELGEKRLLWYVAMVPFLFTFVTGDTTGLNYIFSDILHTDAYSRQIHTDLGALDPWLVFIFFGAGFGGILYIVRRTQKSPSGAMPLIGPLLLVSNAIWWFIFPTLEAFLWATVFHAVQYLAIVVIFHVKDQMGRETNRHSVLYHVLWFYGLCVALGYSLFLIVPLAYEQVGFNKAESALLVAAAINIHHFIVDGYIWKLNKKDSNRKIVDSTETARAKEAVGEAALESQVLS